jgi:glycosyltransferase involved in cell wall biosynthesis
LQVSAAHIYLTYPFVLSWSLLESMSLGCAIVGSNTPPLQEVIEHGKTGLLADFFSPEEIAKNVMTLLDSKDRSQDMRNAARQLIVERFEISDILPLYQQLIKDLAEKRFPPPTNEILLQRQGMSHEQKNKKIAFSQN